MNNNTIIASIKSLFKKEFPYKTVLRIVDYKEKNCYVVFAIPTDKLDKRDEWLDGLHSVDKNTKKINGFQPMDNNPEIYFNLPKERTLYSA